MKKLLIRIGLWLAKLGGWKENYEFSQEQINQTRSIVLQVEEKFPHLSGEFKRSKALRPLRNLGYSERDCGKLIEFVVERYL